MVFTAAAGNDGPTAGPAYPAAYPQVIAVTAVTKDLRNYPYANRGDAYRYRGTRRRYLDSLA